MKIRLNPLNRPALCALALVAAVLLVMPVGGPGARAETDWAKYNQWDLKSFKVTGLPDGLKGQFESQLVLSGRSRILGTRRPPYEAKLLAEDLARIRLFMAREGYPQAETRPVLTVDEAGRQVHLVVEVTPGRPVRVTDISLTGWPERLPAPDHTDPEILHKGDIFRDAAYVTMETRLLGLLHNGGFAEARVERDLHAGPDNGVALVFLVTAGSYYVIDSLNFSGCSPDLLPVAERVANLKTPVEYSAELMTTLATDLRATQLFGQVDLTTETTTPGHLQLNGVLSDGRMRTLDASIGTWSDNPWMLRGGWTHRNLFSKGVGFYGRGVYAKHEERLAAGVMWLGWLSPRAHTRSGYEFLREVEDAYKSRESRIDLVQSFRPNRRDILQVGVMVSLVNVETYIPDPGEIPDDQGKLLELWIDWKWDRTSNPVFPVRGQYLKTSLTVAPPLSVAEYPYVSIQNDVGFFQTVWGPVVLTERLRLGWGTPLGEAADILPTRRFFAGGYNSMRGYERRRLGPKDGAGNSRGGQVVFLAGAEVRFPLFWILEGAVFVDTGEVWRTGAEAAIGDIPVTVGLALDLRTPIGPLRVNHGWNVANQVAGEPDSIWLFGIGYPW